MKAMTSLPPPPPTTPLERFRSFTLLEESPPAKTPMIMRGTLHALRLLEGQAGSALRWYERMLPDKFRLAFAAVEGLEAHAVTHAERLPASARTPAWESLLAWHARYAELDLAQKGRLLMLNNKLCLNRDNERLLASDAEPGFKGASWTEAEAHYAYQRAFSPFMTREGAVKDKPEVFVEIFEKAPSGSRIKFMASNKFMVLCFEHGRYTEATKKALEVNRRALRDLQAAVSPAEGTIWECKFWRGATYFPDREKNDAELWRQMALAVEKGEEGAALARGEAAEDPFLPHFAAESLHGALATAGITSMHHKRHENALGFFSRMVELDPLGAWQRTAVGRMLFELGRYEEAKAQFELAQDLAAIGRDDACERLARCCEKLGRPKEAEAWSERARKIAASVGATLRPA